MPINSSSYLLFVFCFSTSRYNYLLLSHVVMLSMSKKILRTIPTQEQLISNALIYDYLHDEITQQLSWWSLGYKTQTLMRQKRNNATGLQRVSVCICQKRTVLQAASKSRTSNSVRRTKNGIVIIMFTIKVSLYLCSSCLIYDLTN